jgi:hypothetical protein
VTLPTSVEQYYWGKLSSRRYTSLFAGGDDLVELLVQVALRVGVREGLRGKPCNDGLQVCEVPHRLGLLARDLDLDGWGQAIGQAVIDDQLRDVGAALRQGDAARLGSWPGPRA